MAAVPQVMDERVHPTFGDIRILFEVIRGLKNRGRLSVRVSTTFQEIEQRFAIRGIWIFTSIECWIEESIGSPAPPAPFEQIMGNGIDPRPQLRRLRAVELSVEKPRSRDPASVTRQEKRSEIRPGVQEKRRKSHEYRRVVGAEDARCTGASSSALG